MTYTTKNTSAGYSYIPGEFQYSSGVHALEGFKLTRVRFPFVVPLNDGFEAIEAYAADVGVPVTSFASCELRSPAQLTSDQFRSFNQRYVTKLYDWGVATPDDNPVGRSNVCPLVNAPSEPGFFAFTIAVPDKSSPRPSFVITGQAETIATPSNPFEIVAPGNTSEDGLVKKGRVALEEIERRLAAFGLTWSDTTALHAYTVHSFGRLAATEMLPRRAGASGITWHVCHPPVQGADFEMDCRGILDERILTADHLSKLLGK